MTKYVSLAVGLALLYAALNPNVKTKTGRYYTKRERLIMGIGSAAIIALSIHSLVA